MMEVMVLMVREGERRSRVMGVMVLKVREGERRRR